MYFVYVDECGDTGIQKSQTSHYILSGLIIHDTNWNVAFDEIKEYRRTLRTRFGIRLRDEIKARHFIRGKGVWFEKNTSLEERLEVYRELLRLIVNMGCIEVLNVVIRKAEALRQNPTWQPRNVEETAWSFFASRYQTYLAKKPTAENGMIIPDEGHGRSVRDILRKRKRYNPVPSQFDPTRFLHRPLTNVLEDPFMKSSRDSFFIQLADLVAYSLLKKDFPDAAYGFDGDFFDILDPVLLKAATRKDPQGIVYYPEK